ncbi:hypothetical protein B0H67DRAFT_485346 [Lasiosphaeris hirsuta]|uniref:Dihydroorotate dehydrogenase (fumarate) n=1 Tax=Lasiosphaeris hirsuta TaxID=260670 RepID=A0AA40ARJ9_9PEZI|nr:hypothetical protein B0H67DRAFT_485346 [Lasiosphaeris hirsuta]
MTEAPPTLEINPPLINSSNPWATTLEDLRALYAHPSTGAVTTRTSLIKGFGHDPAKHCYVFFDPATHSSSLNPDPIHAGLTQNASLNSLGYSPLTLEQYLGFIKTISDEQTTPSSKGFIVSVTGTPEEVADSYKLIASAKLAVNFPLVMEVNLSCPNIPNKPPPAYSRDALVQYLEKLQDTINTHHELPRIPFGLKTPPYTHLTEYQKLIGALESSAESSAGGVSPVSFLTSTNTLGSCLVISDIPGTFALPGYGIGGMAGAPLHPLALGNVATLRRMLDEDERSGKLGHIRIIGIGGVLDVIGYRRMRSVGAAIVGVGTGLGLKGVGIFGEIETALEGQW